MIGSFPQASPLRPVYSADQPMDALTVSPPIRVITTIHGVGYRYGEG